MMVRLEEIAKKAGVSRATVSRALRNHPRHSRKTCLRIQAIAQRLSYKPNPLVSALMSHVKAAKPIPHIEKIAFVGAFPTPSPVLDLFQGAQEQAKHYGYELEYHWLKAPNMTDKRFSEILYTRSIKGIIMGPQPNPPVPINLIWKYFAIVSTGYSIRAHHFHRASNHQFFSMCILMQNLYKKGYKRIGYFFEPDMDLRVLHQFRAAYLIESDLHKKTRSLIPFLILQHPLKNGQKKFETWFKKYRPDAVVSFHKEGLDWIKNMGLKVPSDCAFASTDVVPQNNISGVNQRHDLVGAAAVDLVIGQINRNERGIPQFPTTININGHWFNGATA